MKIIILLITLFSFSLANDIASWSNFNFENIKFDLDKDVVEDFLQYEGKEKGAIVAIVNEYADKIFENIQKFAIANKLDPFNLTDIEEDFLASSVKLTKGHLDGIASIGRSDDITVSYSSDSKVMEAYFPIVFSNLSFTYDYHVIILLIGPKGSMVGKVKDFKMNIGLSFDFNTYQAAVSEIEVKNKGHISLTFHGNAIVDVVVNILSEFTTAILQPLIGGIVQGIATRIVNLIVDVVNTFIDSILYPATSTVTATAITVTNYF